MLVKKICQGSAGEQKYARGRFFFFFIRVAEMVHVQRIQLFNRCCKQNETVYSLFVPASAGCLCTLKLSAFTDSLTKMFNYIGKHTVVCGLLHQVRMANCYSELNIGPAVNRRYSCHHEAES